MLKTWLTKGAVVWVFITALIVLVPLYNTVSYYGTLITTGIVTEMREGRHSPFRWLLGHIVHPFQKFVVNTSFNRGEAGLPQVHLYVPEASLNALMSDLPASTKKWQPASMLYPDGRIEKIKIRNRGDNVANYLFNKKSWRIKTRKRHLFRGARQYTYIAPRSEAMLEPIISYWIADRLGLLTPNPRLVEMFINNEPHGILFETLHLNEDYLRKNGFMPVTIYKLDRDLEIIANDTREGMRNPKSWSKLSVNNRHSEESTPLLDLLIENHNLAYFDDNAFHRMQRIAPFELWANYAAYDILAQNFHSGTGNVRLIADDQSGHLIPIVWDPRLHAKLYQGTDQYDSDEILFPSAPRLTRKDPDENLDYVLAECAWEIICLYKQSSRFRFLELKTLFKYVVEDEIYSKVLSYINDLKGPYTASLGRDINRTDLMSDISRVLKLTFNPTLSLDMVRKIETGLRNYESSLVRVLGQKPDVYWRVDKTTVFLFIDGPIPLSHVELETAGSPGAIFFDKNTNGLIDHEDIPVPYSQANGAIKLHAKWLSNQRTGKKTPFDMTRFHLLLESPVQIGSLHGRNGLTEHRYKFDSVEQPPRSVYASRRNLPVIEAVRATRRLSGRIAVNEDIVFEDDVIVEAGTTFVLDAGKTIVFRGLLDVRGTETSPVTVLSLTDQPFGSFVIHGPGASGSTVRHLHVSNGSAGTVDGVAYLSMFSINNTSRITIQGLSMENNRHVDDMIHIVYGDDVLLENTRLNNAYLDAIDIDISEVTINDLQISSAGNDCLDLMSSNVILTNSILERCGDKGASVGEASELIVVNSYLRNSYIGVEAKDGSYVGILHSDLVDNELQFSLYNKNWRYGQGGNLIETDKSFIKSSINRVDVKEGSKVIVSDSTIVNGFPDSKRVELLKFNDFSDTREVRTPVFEIRKDRKMVVPLEKPLNQRGAGF